MTATMHDRGRDEMWEDVRNEIADVLGLDPSSLRFHDLRYVLTNLKADAGEARARRPTNPEQAAIVAECDALAAMLLEKNAAYGNSALEPVRVFSKASPIEQILVRIDDKLSRLARGSAAGEDVELDLLGYLILLRVARQKAKMS